MHLSNDDDSMKTKVQQLNWLLLFRINIIVIFLGGTLLYYLREGGYSWFEKDLLPLYLLAFLSLLHALISSVFLRRAKRFKLFVHLQVVWDQLFIIFLIHYSGGVHSFFTLAFILLIVAYSFFLTRRELLLSASGSAILYGSLLDLQYYGYVDSPLAEQMHVAPLSEVVYAVFINVSAYYITALLSGALAARLRQSEHDLARKVIDYKELESLNRIILNNINSGLLLINGDGRIRLFNAAAETITEFGLSDVYDLPLAEFFPNMDVFDGQFKVVSRGDCNIRSKNDQKKHLGYNSTLIKHPLDRHLSLLVTFQDLTELKVAEERFQAAARMASVGQLASGLAHEIRNPLASISGTIQLMLENRSVTEQDSRLMNIAMREVKRLNSLLSDFLLYARPSPPRLELSSSFELLDSLMSLVANDKRFENIKFDDNANVDDFFLLDKEKIRQALWNLILNSAEAMEYKGKIDIYFDSERKSIIVKDEGPGILKEDAPNVFEPFFTTKHSGSGLGLATVFSIMNAHNGQVFVENRNDCGTCFVMEFPGIDAERG